MKLTIFISYSHEDASLVTPIVRLLRATEGLVFLDADSIKPGKKWQQEITKGLETAKLVVVFWCNHSGQSTEVKKEYAAAIAAGKDLLPVLLDSYPVPDDLAEFQWIDFREIVGPAHDWRGEWPYEPPPLKEAEPEMVKASPKVWGYGIALATIISLVGVILLVSQWSGPDHLPPPEHDPHPMAQLPWSPGVIGLGMFMLGLLSVLLYKLIKNFTAKEIIPEGTRKDELTQITHPELFGELDAKAEEKIAEKLRDEIVQRTGFKAG